MGVFGGVVSAESQSKVMVRIWRDFCRCPLKDPSAGPGLRGEVAHSPVLAVGHRTNLTVTGAPRGWLLVAALLSRPWEK